MARWGAGHKLPHPIGLELDQVKDQIGSFFCFPSVDFQRAAGGYGGFIINSRDVIAVPFDKPHGDITLFIGDWYNKDYKARRLKPSRRLHQKQRVPDEAIPPCNHNMLLVETQGSYTVQQNYTNLDIHVGQSYSFLVTMDQNPSSDYYTVASARFVNESRWSRDTGVAVLHCSNSKGKASGPLPDPPNDFYDKTFSMNQARSIRFVCGGKNHKEQLDTDISRLCGCVCYQVESERWRGAAESSGIVQIRNDQCVSGVRPEEQATGGDQRKTTMDHGEWTEESRGTYNKGDGVARCSTQVLTMETFRLPRSMDCNLGFAGQRRDLEREGTESGFMLARSYFKSRSLHLFWTSFSEQTPHHKTASSASATHRTSELLVLMLLLLGIA
ncbi:hypothetical protein GW17_00002488 [Ensete ventricosum]|nr:hypothetical protein GW17_00002488 [Ensete ventricosum]